MQESTSQRDAQHLIRQILNRNNNVPNFALSLGAGASSHSGIRTATEMIEGWRKELFARANSAEPFQAWLEKQDWYDDDDEYAVLFEQMYDQPSQRRVYVEGCIKNAHPSWGYVYLANLLAHKIFNVVFTTNFDDLINEACYLYSEGLRPMVAAHDSAVTSIRITYDRPKIIKLHGDFLYDNIKNTLHELETLENNTKKKLTQFAQEYGLVVVGYGGRDRSVMDILEVLSRSEEYFKQGVYWCVRSGATPGKRLRSLLRRDRVYLVEIPGFDEFMGEIHDAAVLNLPNSLANPFAVARDRARLFVNIPDPLRANRIIARDVKKVLDAIERAPAEELIPPELSGIVRKEKGDFSGAIDHLRQALKEVPNDESIAYQLGETLARAGRHEELIKFVEEAPLSAHNKSYFLLLEGNNEAVIRIADQALQSHPTDHISRINRAIAFRRLGREKEMNSDIKVLEDANPLKYQTYGAYAIAVAAAIAGLKKNKPEMLKYIKLALERSILTPENIEMFPVFEEFRNDSDLKKIITDWKQKTSPS